MSKAVRELLTAFDRLSADEQREAVVEILRVTRTLDYPPLDEETINRIAEESFLEYDAHEGPSGASDTR